MKTKITKTTQNETKNFLGSLITKASMTFVLASTLTLSAVAGPISDGGGNAVNYKIIESYHKDINDLSSYKNYTLPLLNDLKTKLPHFVNVIEKQQSKMTFYFVPRKNKLLAEKYTGLPFESDQVALNKIESGEVFIDEDLANKMSPNERGLLLLHEIIESIVLKDRSPSSYAKEMNRVRKTVIILAQTQKLSPAEIRERLLEVHPIWKDQNLTRLWTVGQINDFERQQTQTKSILKPLAITIYESTERFCKTVRHLTVTESQIQKQLTPAESQLLREELIQFSTVVTPIAYKAQIFSLDYDGDRNNVAPKDILPLYEVDSVYAKYYIDIFKETNYGFKSQDLLKRPASLYSNMNFRDSSMIDEIVEFSSRNCDKLQLLKKQIDINFAD